MDDATDTPGRGEHARRVREIMQQEVAPLLGPGENGRFVAIDVNTGEYEIADDENEAVDRLSARMAGADIWVECVGEDGYCRLGFRASWGVYFESDEVS